MIITQPVSADHFIDTIGINTHLHYTDTVYNKFDDVIKPNLVDLGVRHVRDGAMTYDGINADSFYYQRVRELANQGIRFTFITQSLDTPWTQPTNYDLLDDVYAWSSQSVLAFEGVNEPDIQGVESWVPAVIEGQQQLYATVKDNPQLQGLAVVGPSVVNPGNLELLGDQSDLLDFGNIHNYFAGRHPETGGWGDNGYGSVAWNIAQAAKISGTDPIVSTETGWHNTRDADGNIVGVPQDIEAKYIPRLFLTHFNEGIARTYLYELIDTWDQPTRRDANFGLLNNDGTPQPGFLALKHLIEILEDPGPAFTPVPAEFSLAGETNAVQATLLQKRNGTYILALWLGKSSWDPNAKRRIDVPTQAVTLQLPSGFTNATLRQFQSDGSVSQTPATVAEGQISLRLGDTITLVELTPPENYVPVLDTANLEGDRLTNLAEGQMLMATSALPPVGVPNTPESWSFNPDGEQWDGGSSPDPLPPESSAIAPLPAYSHSPGSSDTIAPFAASDTSSQALITGSTPPITAELST